MNHPPCVGRNVTIMGSLKVLALRYHFELLDLTHDRVLLEGFLVEPTELCDRITRRD